MVNIIIIILLIILILLALANFFKKDKNAKLNKQIDYLSQNLQALRSDLDGQMSLNRQELSGNLYQVQDLVGQNLAHLTEQINEKFDRKFQDLQDSNDKKLGQIQETVDEKLQKTLNERINQSFAQVTNLLTSVDKGLGEMRNLASDVDSLQKVMTGVKTRGIVGEIQLGRILSEIFTAGQYAEQVNIQGNNAVDYAVILPGKNNGQLFLPIDSKFPQEDYLRLIEAQENSDKTAVEAARKALFAAVKTQAKSISEKYILAPKTTDFAIMFLPTEGLFMEVVNNVALYEQISRDYKVNITGPTTLTAVLNSLQMGFKTLQIEQKSSEVYELLGAIKTEFGRFETSLKKVHERLKQSENEINTLITTRTNVMNRKLRSIEEVDQVAASSLLELD